MEEAAAVLSPSSEKRVKRRRQRRDPKPRFKPDVSGQLDAISGCPEIQVPKGNLARHVKQLLCELDLSSLQERYSSLGMRGYDPRHVLGAWVMGSILGIHYATVLSDALKGMPALRLVAGGHAMSAGTLKRFRALGEFFEPLLAQTLKLAHERGLLKPEELAADSVRLRAHASLGAVRTLERSRRRLEELSCVEAQALPENERLSHEEKRQKHEAAVRICEERGTTSVVVTHPGAALMKFPYGAYAPGQRVTVAGAGVKERLVVAALVDASTNDYGNLGPIAERTRKALHEAGIPTDATLQMAADAGYFSEVDLQWAMDAAPGVDVLIPEPPSHSNRGRVKGLFPREAFRFDGTQVTCPAGTLMTGPVRDGRGEVKWTGVGCAECPLRPQCTKGKARSLTVNPAFDAAREHMSQRMQKPGAKARYNQRIATIEPVFSELEHTMGFRRLSTRHPENSVAEVMLKLFAYNVKRLASAAKKLLCVYFLVCQDALGSAYLLPLESR
jgi:hypothetical protein